MEETQDSERASKRLKLDRNEDSSVCTKEDSEIQEANKDPPTTTAIPQDKATDNVTTMEAQTVKESEVGISGYVNTSSEGFTGILKKRYTDFLVNEILPSGVVCHLKTTKAPRAGRKEPQGITTSDEVEAVVKDTGQEDPSRPSDDASVNYKTEAVNGASQDENATGENEPQREIRELEPANVPNEGITRPTIETTEAPKEGEVSAADRALLVSYLNEKAVEDLLELYSKVLAHPNIRPKEHGTVRTDFTSDRSIRGQIHQAIRRIFNSRIDSSTDNEGILVLSAALPSYRRPQNQPGRGGGHGGRDRGGKLTWAERGGDYLHFSLFKENKDTMEVISFLARQLKTNAKSFQFAGTKDRRAVTVQRVSAYRLEAERVAGINRSLRGSQIGDFEYQTHGLELGDLKGNEFVITLRDCIFPSLDSSLSTAAKATTAHDLISNALAALHTNGFTNYYGLQRFGTFSTRTDTVGVALLRGNFALACSLLLAYTPSALAAAQNVNSDSDHVTNTTPIGQDDKNRAMAIHMFQSGSNRDLNQILDILPHKFSAESNIIRHLHRQASDHYGAIQMIPRNLKLMYVHAYQSLVWNFAASARWSLYGSSVAAGDLVLVHEHADKVAPQVSEPSVDADGEVVVMPSADDRSNTAEEMFERARPLTSAEAGSGQYSIFDVVLPQPGFDVLYPSNAVGDFYKSFMSSEQGGGLDPNDMRRKQKDFSLSGSYRKVMAQIGRDYEVQVRSYREDSEQFVETDLEKLKKAGTAGNGYRGLEKPEVAEDNQSEGDKMAVVLKFQLGSSQYATMALRELTRGGVEAHKPDFGGRG